MANLPLIYDSTASPHAKDEWRVFVPENKFYEIRHPASWDVGGGKTYDGQNFHSFGAQTNKGGIDGIVSIYDYIDHDPGYSTKTPAKVDEEANIILDGEPAVLRKFEDYQTHLPIIVVRTVHPRTGCNLVIALYKTQYQDDFSKMLESFRFR